MTYMAAQLHIPLADVMKAVNMHHDLFHKSNAVKYFAALKALPTGEGVRVPLILAQAALGAPARKKSMIGFKLTACTGGWTAASDGSGALLSVPQKSERRATGERRHAAYDGECGAF
jgi:hypothetical protein